MESDTILIITIIVIAIIVIIAAWNWEMNEMHLLENKKTLNEVPEGEREEYLQELACFAWSEAVAWRRIVIGTIFATFLIFLYLRRTTEMSLVSILSIAIIIAATFITIDMFRTFHWDRQVCMKATPDAPWFSHTD